MSLGYDGQELDPVLDDDHRVGVAEAAELVVVEARLDREDHARLDRRVVADVEERRLVVAQPDRVARVLPPVREQVVVLEVAHDGAVDVGARHARPKRIERDLLRGDDVVEEPALLVGRRADDHRPLELGVVAPHRRARLRDEHVARLELDVVRDRVRPRAARADLAAVARLRRRRSMPSWPPNESPSASSIASVASWPGAQARLCLGRARPRVLLQQPVRVRAPAAALADQRDLVVALARHHPLDRRRDQRSDRRARDRR